MIGDDVDDLFDDAYQYDNGNEDIEAELDELYELIWEVEEELREALDNDDYDKALDAELDELYAEEDALYDELDNRFGNIFEFNHVFGLIGHALQ